MDSHILSLLITNELTDMKFKSMKELQILRAKRIMQELRTLDREGVIYINNPLECLTRAEYMKRFRNDITYRINRKLPDGNAFKDNANRAGDIIRNGENSKWWNARNSTHHAGSDVRGIVHHVVKIRKRIAES